MNQINIDTIKDQLLKSCIVNGGIGSLKEIEEMGVIEFGKCAKLYMPTKLYKYYSNLDTMLPDGSTVNYSQQALINNTVYMQTPTAFDDVYDSDISIDHGEYERLRVMEYCRRCGIDVKENWTNQEAGDALVKALWPFYLEKALEKAFIVAPANELERLSNRNFCLTILVKCQSADNFGRAVSDAITEEFQKYSEHLQTVFRTACFATSPYSQLMWGGSYADQHRGFCVEYTVCPQDKVYENIYLQLFPMIYCKTRPDVTAKLVQAKDKEPTDELLWDIYFHGALRKSIDWAYQNEWRLLLPLGKNSSDYNVTFFPITKVFLGNRMTAQNRKVIIDICKRRSIPYVGVKRNPKLFEMQDCEVLCENCSNFLNIHK